MSASDREKKNAQGREHYLRTIESQRVRSKRYASENYESAYSRQRKWVAENREYVADRARAWAENNRAKLVGYTRKWQAENKDAVAAIWGKRRARKLNATPAWANEFFIREAYHIARVRTKVTGIKWHVDHIVPLQSKLVCGLHVEHNLQVIPAVSNMVKGNRHWPNQPE